MRKTIYILLITLGLISCSGKELIPEKDMQSIITETLISNAIHQSELNGERDLKKRREIDSMDIYLPILKKYGYTLADFDYTLRTLAMRKSKPLENIFENVGRSIDGYDAMAGGIYTRMVAYDSMAMRRYVDTLYRKDTLIIGSIAKYKIPDLYRVKSGKYILTLDYTIMPNNALGNKSVKYAVRSRDKTRNNNTVYWLNRSNKKETLKAEIELIRDCDTMSFEFVESKPYKDVSGIKDTSMIENIVIAYYPELPKMRRDYYYEQTGFVPSLKRYYEQKYPYLSDSVAIPFERPRGVQ